MSRGLFTGSCEQTLALAAEGGMARGGETREGVVRPPDQVKVAEAGPKEEAGNTERRVDLRDMQE